MNNFDIKVNGRIFTLWKSAEYERSLDNVCGTFSFVSTDKLSQPYPVKKGDSVQILINNTIVLSGFVDSITINGDVNGTLITVSGRDKTSDLVDSSVPNDVKNNEGALSFISICSSILSNLGISASVINNVDDLKPFNDNDLEAASSGENAFNFLNGFARKRQVYLRSDGSGNLVIFRPGKIKASTDIINEKNNRYNNVKKFSYSNTDESRYNNYVVRSQENVGFDPFADYKGDGAEKEGNATDAEIRGSRYLEIIGEEAMTNGEATERANEESNIRRARGFSYKATLAGIKQDNGQLWDIGLLVNIRDYKCDVYGQYLIKSIKISQSLEGSQTELEMVEPDAYNLIPSKTKSSGRKSKTGVKYTF